MMAIEAATLAPMTMVTTASSNKTRRNRVREVRLLIADVYPVPFVVPHRPMRHFGSLLGARDTLSAVGRHVRPGKTHYPQSTGYTPDAPTRSFTDLHIRCQYLARCVALSR